MIVVKLEEDIKMKDKALESSRKKSMSLEQRVQQMEQQHQQAIQQMDHQHQQALQQMSQRIRELEQGELQKRMCEMERENQCLSQRLKCKICQMEEVQVLLSPCNHLVCCKNCVSNLPKKECPICVTKIQGTIKMFFA